MTDEIKEFIKQKITEGLPDYGIFPLIRKEFPQYQFNILSMIDLVNKLRLESAAPEVKQESEPIKLNESDISNLHLADTNLKDYNDIISLFSSGKISEIAKTKLEALTEIIEKRLALTLKNEFVSRKLEFETATMMKLLFELYKVVAPIVQEQKDYSAVDLDLGKSGEWWKDLADQIMNKEIKK